MPNYNQVTGTNPGGIYATPSGPAAGLGLSSTRYDPNNPINLGWITPSTEEDTYWDWSTASWKRKPTSPTQIGLPSGPGEGPQGPGGVALPPGTQPTTGRAAGVQVPYSGQVINPNDPSQRYRAVDITKLPDIAGAESDLMTSFKKGAADSMKGFDEWLNTFKTSLAGAFQKSQVATDTAGVAGALRADQSRYSAALDKAAADYANLNRQTAANEQGIVTEARNLIPEYDRAAQDAASQQMALLQANVGRYKMGTGTPTSLGSAEQELLARGAAEILVPMKQAQIQQRYAVLSNYAMPVAMDIANREQERIGKFDPFVAQQQFQSGQVTEETISQLETIAAQMARTDAVAFMNAISVPVEIQQRILSGQIGQAGALGQLEASSRYSALQDVLGAVPTQPQYYGTGMGPYPQSSRYSPALGAQGIQQPNLGWTGGGASATLRASRYGAASPWVADYGNQRWVNTQTGEFRPMQVGDTRFLNQGAPPSPYSDQAGYEYNPLDQPGVESTG